MANNRLFIQCTVCGAEITIARLSAGDAEWSPARGNEADGWAAFLVEHGQHDGDLHVALTSENDLQIAVALHNPSSHT